MKIDVDSCILYLMGVLDLLGKRICLLLNIFTLVFKCLNFTNLIPLLHTNTFFALGEGLVHPSAIPSTLCILDHWCVCEPSSPSRIISDDWQKLFIAVRLMTQVQLKAVARSVYVRAVSLFDEVYTSVLIKNYRSQVFIIHWPLQIYMISLLLCLSICSSIYEY